MKTKYKHLNCEERTLIQLSLERGCTLRAIARSLDRNPSSVSRELSRNGWCNPKAVPIRGPGRPALAGGYRAAPAQLRAHLAQTMARKSARLASDSYLWSQVKKLLKQRYSPEQIAGILPRMFPDDLSMRVSHETIYTALYAMPRGELRTELLATLRQARKTRRPRARGEDRRGEISNMTSIHQRPPEVDERIIPGHWEGDLIKGRGNASAVGTLVERTSLFVTLAKVVDGTAAAAVEGFSTVLNRIDEQRRLSMTYDQGKEMAQHAQLTERTGVAVYFADPHSPWQRGINENTNGLLRQYLPKGIDLSVFSQEELDAVAWSLNTRPRKSLGFKCPAELFLPDTFNADLYYSRLVALHI
jgi:transposase, IS30 family